MHLFFAKSAENSGTCRWCIENSIDIYLLHRCDVIPFDMTGNNNDTDGQIDQKSNQWFGATISSSGEDGVIVVSFQ